MTADEVKAIVEKILEELPKEYCRREAVNWADLHCTEARQFVDGGWYIEVSEASPDAAILRGLIEMDLASAGIDAHVETAW